MSMAVRMARTEWRKAFHARIGHQAEAQRRLSTLDWSNYASCEKYMLTVAQVDVAANAERNAFIALMDAMFVEPSETPDAVIGDSAAVERVLDVGPEPNMPIHKSYAGRRETQGEAK